MGKAKPKKKIIIIILSFILQYLAGHESSKPTMDIYAKSKYNKPEELCGVVNAAFYQSAAV